MVRIVVLRDSPFSRPQPKQTLGRPPAPSAPVRLRVVPVGERGTQRKLTEDQVDQEYGSQSAKLNGPRHWVIDAAQSTGGNSSSTKTFTFGGIETGLKGVITTQANQPTVGDQFYTPSEVARSTIWTYKAGKPVFELTAPDGSVYVMQSYAQIADKTLTYPPVGRSREQTKAAGRMELQVRDPDDGTESEQQRPRHCGQ